MSAPDPKAVKAALRDLDAAHRCVGRHMLAPGTLRTLEAAAFAYLDAQGAEIAREALASRIGDLVLRKMVSANRIPMERCTITADEIAALTPTDAETKL